MMKIKNDKTLLDAGSDCGADISSNADEIREINDRWRELMERAPSDATSHFVLRKVGDRFKGLLRIRTSHQSFGKGAAGNNLVEVVNTIFSEVNAQIRGWRRTRELQAVNSGSVWE